MLVTVTGVVLAYSKEWRDGKFSPYRKIHIGFPKEPDIPTLWCTVFGKSNWGYREDGSGRLIEQRLRRGLQIRITGQLEFGGEEGRRLSVKSSGSTRGGFEVLGDFRKYFIVPVPGSAWKVDDDGYWRFKVDKEAVIFSGEYVQPLPLLTARADHTPLYKAVFPPEGADLVIDGEPILIGMNPHVWFFDSWARTTIISGVPI